MGSGSGRGRAGRGKAHHSGLGLSFSGTVRRMRAVQSCQCLCVGPCAVSAAWANLKLREGGWPFGGAVRQRGHFGEIPSGAGTAGGGA